MSSSVLFALLLFATSPFLCRGDCEVPGYQSEDDCSNVCNIKYGAKPDELLMGQCHKDVDDDCYKCDCEYKSEEECKTWVGDNSDTRDCQRAPASGCLMYCYKDEPSCLESCTEDDNFCRDDTDRAENTCFVCSSGKLIGLPLWVWLLIGLGVLLLIVAVVVLILCCCCGCCCFAAKAIK